MILKRLLLAAAFALVAAPLLVAAQSAPHMPKPGSNPNPHAESPHPNNGPTRNQLPWGSRPRTAPRASSKYSFTGTITEIDLIYGFVAIEAPKGRIRRFYVGEETRFTADKGTALADRESLSLEDFQKGQTIKISFGSQGFGATEVRLRRPKN